MEYKIKNFFSKYKLPIFLKRGLGLFLIILGILLSIFPFIPGTIPIIMGLVLIVSGRKIKPIIKIRKGLTFIFFYIYNHIKHGIKFKKFKHKYNHHNGVLFQKTIDMKNHLKDIFLKKE